MELHNVHLLMINDGDAVSVHATREGAHAALAQYARENWELEFDEPLPELDDREITRQFFNRRADEEGARFRGWSILYLPVLSMDTGEDK